MRKKQKQAILLAAMITLALQTGTTYAKEIDPGIYDEYVEFKKDAYGSAGNVFISLDENAPEDKTYTFTNGALIDAFDNGADDNIVIRNESDKKLTINTGNENIQSVFKINMPSKYASRSGGGIRTSNNSINNINAINTDIIIESKGTYSDGGIETLENSILTIDGKNTNTNLKIEGFFLGTDAGISAYGNSQLNIKDVNNIEIVSNKTDEASYFSGIWLEGNTTANIIANNFKIEDVNSDNAECYESSLIDSTGIDLRDNSSLNLKVKNDVNIKTAAAGLVLNVNNVDISAKNIYIEATDPVNLGSSQSYRNNFGSAVILGTNLTSEKTANTSLQVVDKINLKGKNHGIYMYNNANLDVVSKNNSVTIIGQDGNGILNEVIAESNKANSNININANKNVNIYGGEAGIYLLANNNKMNISSQNGEVLILSDTAGIKADTSTYSTYTEDHHTDIDIISNKDLKIVGNNSGIQYYRVGGNLDLKSTDGDVYIQGDDIALVSDSRSNEDIVNTFEGGNRGNEIITVKSEKGNIYIGGINNNKAINNNEGISISGKNSLNLNAANIVQIEGKESALKAKKETNNIIKGNFINLYSSEGTAINTEGVNTLNIGYNDDDNKNTELLSISGDIGIEQRANSLGEDDMSSLLDEKYQILGENNKTDLKAEKIAITGNRFGIKMVQTATEKDVDKDKLVREWRNNVLNITADKNILIQANSGTAIDVDGINKLNIINDWGTNYIEGKDKGINLYLKKLDIDNLSTEIKNYKVNTISDYIKNNKLPNSAYAKYWNTSYADYIQVFIKNRYGYNSINDFYQDMLNGFSKNPWLKNDFADDEDFQELIKDMDKNGDALVNSVKFLEMEVNVLIDVSEYIDLDKLHDMTYGDTEIEKEKKKHNVNTIEELYDYYRNNIYYSNTNGFINIADNIDATNDFNLITGDNGTNYVLGGNEALKVDGELNAHIKGGSNVISNDIGIAAKSDTSKYAVHGENGANINIEATNGTNTIQSLGTGIYAREINSMNIGSTFGNNYIKGDKAGIDLANNSKEDYAQYKYDTSLNFIKDESRLDDEEWNTLCSQEYIDSYEEWAKDMHYDSFAALYEDLFNNPIFKEDPDIAMMIENMDPNGDPVINMIQAPMVIELKEMATYFNYSSLEALYKDLFTNKEVSEELGITEYLDMMDPEGDPVTNLCKILYGTDFDKFYETTYGDLAIEESLRDANVSNLDEFYYFLKEKNLITEDGLIVPIVTHSEFNLTTDDNGTNYILGGNEALKAVGEFSAHIKGGSNVISNNIGIAAKSDTPKYAVHGENGAQIDIEATNGDNIIQSTDIGVYAVGDNTDINIKNTSSSSIENAQTLITAVNEGIIAKDLADININGDNSDVNILSGSKGIWATGNGANVNIAGKGVNITATGNNDEKIAVVAGLEDTSTSSDINSVVNINTTGNSTSTIFGDIIGARNGIVNINSNNSKTVHQGNLFIKGDILAGNGGSVDVNLGNGGYFEGRADDYQDAAEKTGKSFFNPHFTNGTVETEGTLNLTLGSNATWKVTGQSWVTQVNSDNGFIDLCSANTDRNEIGKALTIRTLEGDANFKMSLDGNRSASDMLYIKDGNGTYNVILDDAVSKDEIGLTGLRFATSDDKYSNVKFDKVVALDKGVFNVRYAVGTDDYQGNKENDIYNNGKGTINNEMNEYKPGTDSVDKFLQEDLNEQHEAQIQTLSLKEKSAAEIDATNHKIIDIAEQTISDAGKTILNMAQANYSNAIYLDTLNKRMGEARYIDGNDGIWVRMGHYSLGKENKFESDHNLYQLGYDKLYETENGQRRIGAAIDYMSGNAAYKNTFGSGDLDRKGITLYDTWTGNKGHYTDYVFRWGHLENNFDLYAKTTGEKISGDYDNDVFSLSGEYGYKKQLGNDWYIEPQVQLQYAHLTDADYMTTQNTRVSVDGADSLIARAGFRLGKDIGENKKTTIYIKGDIQHEFLGDQDITASDKTGTLKGTIENDGTWYTLGFGVSTMLSDSSYAYLDYERYFGNDNDNTYQINGGVRWLL
ncbi:autotransporter outer membrane beta-barrel domain-containing protein [Megamonas hypermegale]|uniref:autotransporter outer membrane beta-barrel domain-containing protein n=1 Tax=Megamonas hypermegale TaxID=158847 RepID=UPI0026F071A0|nr:autotransporter outer membrane beta-barrel domain-containing protein [Megamonas hypermegale]